MNFMEKLTPQNKAELSAFIKEKGRTLEEIKRAQAVLMLSEGLSGTLILSMTGIKRQTAVKIRKKYVRGGVTAIKSQRKEKKNASLLTKKQREEIEQMLHAKNPQNYGYDCKYWTPTILGDVIFELYGIKYKSKTSLYLVFKQSKFTYHKPEKIYQKRNQKEIDLWKEKNEEIVQKAWQDPDTVIIVADEMMLTSQTTLQRVWLPQNTQPKIESSNTRKHKSIYGFLSLKDGKEFAFKSDRQTNEISAKFLDKVLDYYEGKKVILFWDNAPWHRGEFMKICFSKRNNFLAINFPPYAPDENPQEHVWKDVRAKVTHNKFISDIDSIVQELITYLNNTIFNYQFFGFKAS